MTRKVTFPRKYDDFIDGTIPAEYFEQDYILFEEYMMFTGFRRENTKEDPHANSDFLLAKFHDFERFMKRESRNHMLATEVCYFNKWYVSVFVPYRHHVGKEHVGQIHISIFLQNHFYHHDISALKLAVAKRMLGGDHAGRGKFLHHRNVIVEVPMSRATFLQAFSTCLPENIDIPDGAQTKFHIPVSSLDLVLGNNWHCVMLRNSQTVRRIIGAVHVHFRPKHTNFTMTGRNRYWYYLFTIAHLTLLCWALHINISK